MTVKLLCDWGKYKLGNLVTLTAAEETGLIAQGIASSNLTGGTAYVAPSSQLNFGADVVAALAAAATLTASQVIAVLQGGGGGGNGSSLATTPYYTEHSGWQVKKQDAGPFTVGGITRNDEAFALGYNIDSADSNYKSTEPRFALRQENDYVVTALNSTMRSTEHYLTWQARENAAEYRAWFFSYIPDTSGNGSLNYGYLTTGDNLLQTPGGGGFSICAGSYQGANIVPAAFDIEGTKLLKAQIFNDAYQSITSATSGANCVLTVPSGHGLQPGAVIRVASLDAAGTKGIGYHDIAGGSAINITAVTATTLTTDFTNTGGTLITSTNYFKRALPNAYSAAAEALGLGTTIISGNTNVLDVVGPARFRGQMYLNDTTGVPAYFTHNKLTGAYQLQRYTKGDFSADLAMGFMQDQTSAVIGWGAYQSTDANFKQNVSYLTVGANGIGIGNTSATTDGRVRINAGGSTTAQLQLEKHSTDYSGTSAALQLWADTNGVLMSKTGTSGKKVSGDQPKTFVSTSNSQTITLPNYSRQTLQINGGGSTGVTINLPTANVSDGDYVDISIVNALGGSPTMNPALLSGATAVSGSMGWRRLYYSSTMGGWA